MGVIFAMDVVLLLLFLQANPNKERILYSGFSSFISI